MIIKVIFSKLNLRTLINYVSVFFAFIVLPFSASAFDKSDFFIPSKDASFFEKLMLSFKAETAEVFVEQGRSLPAYLTNSLEEENSVIALATITVTNTNDAGTGSLRQAITDANATAAADIIAFNIPGTGPHTISPASPFPTMTKPVLIDGSTQPGYTSTPLIEINATNVPSYGNGLYFANNSNSGVKALCINRSQSRGIYMVNSTNMIVEDCIIGMDPTGLIPLGNAGMGIAFVGDGILVSGCVITNNGGGQFQNVSGANIEITNNIIGLDITGMAIHPPANSTMHGIEVRAADNVLIQDNIVSGSTGHAMYLAGSGTNLEILNNKIGTDISGNIDLGNDGDGIQTSSYTPVDIFDNVIGGSGRYGVLASNNNFSFLRNRIGIGVNGTDIGNDQEGVYLQDLSTHVFTNSQIGDGTIANANTIAYNGKTTSTADGIAIRRLSTLTIPINTNIIHDNADLGIDLQINGVSNNDAGDGDTGANDFLNFPVVNSSELSTDLAVDFDLDIPTGDYRVEVFGIPAGSEDPSMHGEGDTYLGSFNINHTGSGSENFVNTITGPIAISVGDKISLTTTSCIDATCTDYKATSEFSEVAEVAAAAVLVEICNNGIDDDGDGLIDCNDPDCSMELSCLNCNHNVIELAAAALNSSVSAQEMQAANGPLWYQVAPETGYDYGVAINATGINQQITVPAGVSQVKIISWGAGGGGGTGLASTESSFGGGGGYAEGILAVTPGDVLDIIVGEGGGISTTANFTPQVGAYGGGAAAGEHTSTTTSQDVFSQSGGGRSAVRLNGVEVLTAGGGGGSVFSSTGNCAFSPYGGAGGGANGIDGTFGGGTLGATGGTQTAGGIGHVSNDPTGNGLDGIQFEGGLGGLDNGINIGNHGGGGGGGGGGYYGGGGGRGDRGATCAFEETPGAGGSSYVGGVSSGLTIAGSQNNVANDTSPYYEVGIGIGGDDQALKKDQGGHGLVVLQWINTVANCVEICNNGIDDDGDGLIDSADPDCSTSSPILFTQSIKRVGAPTICDILTANPADPIGALDCDGGGQTNLDECNAGQDPEDASDDTSCVDLSTSPNLTGTVNIESYFTIGCSMSPNSNKCLYPATVFSPMDANMAEVLGAANCDFNICNTSGTPGGVGTPTCETPSGPVSSSLIETLFHNTDANGLPAITTISDGVFVPTNAGTSLEEYSCTHSEFIGGDLSPACATPSIANSWEMTTVEGWVLVPCNRDLKFRVSIVGLQYRAGYISTDEGATFQFMGECNYGNGIIQYDIPAYNCCGSTDGATEKAYYFKLYNLDPGAGGRVTLKWNITNNGASSNFVTLTIPSSNLSAVKP